MYRFICIWITLFSLAFLLGGCSINGRVLPQPNRAVAALCADDIVLMMDRAGFTENEILHFGTELRNSLGTTGAARIKLDTRTEAVFAVVDGNVHVSSRKRGSFIYNMKTRQCL